MHEPSSIASVLQGRSDKLTQSAQHAGLCQSALRAMADGVASVARAPTLVELQVHYVHAVLEVCGGNKTHAARVLGIGRRSLYRWLARKVG